MRARGILCAALVALTAVSSAARAEPLVLAYGRVSQSATESDAVPGGPVALATVVEHVEFLLAHGYAVGGLEEAEGASDKTAILTFDEPESFERLVLPLLELWQVPVVVTVPVGTSGESTSGMAIRRVAASPWVRLMPRVDELEVAGGTTTASCEEPGVAAEPVESSQEAALSTLARGLGATLAFLRSVGSGDAPGGVVWSPGTFYGPAESVAGGLGLRRQLVTVAESEPSAGTVPGVWPRFPVHSQDGVWLLPEAEERWVPSAHPVRFVEFSGDWICGISVPAERLDRLEDLVSRLGLNGVRVRSRETGGTWFPTRQLSPSGTVLGVAVRRLRGLETVRWILVDFPSTGDETRDAALASDLARAVDLDVAILPRVPWSARLREVVRYVRPLARIAWRDREDPDAFAFDWSPRSAVGEGRTVRAGDVNDLDRELLEASSRGTPWLGATAETLDRAVAGASVPVEMALPAARTPPEQRPASPPQPVIREGGRDRDRGSG